MQSAFRFTIPEILEYGFFGKPCLAKFLGENIYLKDIERNKLGPREALLLVF